MKTKVGKSLVFMDMYRFFVAAELPKKIWIEDYSSNSAVKKVYGIYNIETDEYSGQLPHIDKTYSYTKFCNQIVSKLNPKSKYSQEGDFQEIVECAYENEENLVYRKFYITEALTEYKFNNCKIAIVPYNDGICLCSIVVDDDNRNKGIGTKIMNELYDISEELSIPIYINPYPAGKQFQPNKELELVTKLKKWYSKIGFGPVIENSLVWSNFE